MIHNKLVLFIPFLLLSCTSCKGRLMSDRSSWFDGSGDSSDSGDTGDSDNGDLDDGGMGGGTVETLCDGYGGPPVRLWTLQELAQNKTHCNVVFYDRVYWLDEFIPIHKGGAFAIRRNCGKDATWEFEHLQCIASVPDHFEGMLNMCNTYVVGALAGSSEDPCASTTDPWTPPVHEYPDFESCDVYDNITCTDLDTMPNNGAWSLQDVIDAQGPYEVDWTSTSVEHCYTILHNWVFDLGVSPLDGSGPFYKKHGNGEYPRAILDYCGKDMTEAFSRTVDQDRLCVPDHTLGGLNVLSGYVVGVVAGSIVDPCLYEPPSPCEALGLKKMDFYTMRQVRSLPGCPIVVLGKVYDLTEFADHHYGGRDAIVEHCGSDITEDFLEETVHHPLFHLGLIQNFQIGVITNGLNDPCGQNYKEQVDF